MSGNFYVLQARAAAYVNNTLPLALAVHEISRHFWAAYDLTSCGWLQTFQKKALAKNRSREILHWMESAFSNYLLSSSKRLQRSNWFLPLWNQLKSTLGPAGNRSSPPRALYITALTITPPCQLLNSHTFFILPNRFLPLWNERKRSRGPAGIRSSPSRLGAPQHHHYTTVNFLSYRILFFRSWANLL